MLCNDTLRVDLYRSLCRKEKIDQMQHPGKWCIWRNDVDAMGAGGLWLSTASRFSCSYFYMLGGAAFVFNSFNYVDSLRI